MSRKQIIEQNKFNIAVCKFHNANLNWRNYWWEAVCAIIEKDPTILETYIIDYENRTVTERIIEITPTKTSRKKTIKVTDTLINFGNISIEYLNNAEQYDTPTGEKTYFFKFYENNENYPIFDKIGTTKKSCLNRLKDEIRYYNKREFNITRVEICGIWDCGEVPAESYESFMRALLIKKFPNTWRKNDRFFGTNIPIDVFLSLCEQYASL